MKSRRKEKEEELILLNSEGPVLTAKKAHDDEYVLYDTDNSIVDILNLDEFKDFIYNNVPVTGTDGKDIYYRSHSVDMRAKDADIEVFIKGVESFVPSNTIDGSWISPVKSEKEWQESVLKELFPSYPNGAPRWQYLNGLLHIALEYKKQLDSDDEENEEEENG